MSQLQLKNVSEQLLRRLADRAVQHGRSVEDEAIECIAEAVGDARIQRDRIEARRRLRELRRTLSERGVCSTPEEIEAAINFGRE